MLVSQPPPKTTIASSDMTGEQLALKSSERVSTITCHGVVTGGKVKNGCQVFLNVPYGLDVPRWTDPKPLPEDYQYTSKEYTVDGLYCAQPGRPYSIQAPVRDRLGLGLPTESPFFCDIYVPSHYSLNFGKPLLPVQVFIHGGFLQYGSTSGQHYNQQFFRAEHFNEVRVLIGHRVSVLGFLGCEKPKVTGNFGFKDCWLGLEWIQKNIAAFGGDPKQVHLSGLSGGGHVVSQLLHQAARLAPQEAPFITALLHSNAILTNPVSPSTRSAQFDAFCTALGADRSHPDILDHLRDKARFPTAQLITAVESMGNMSTFRGVIGTDGWLRVDEMQFQQSGGLAAGLRAAGVRCVIVGDVKDEDSFYRTVHPCSSPDDIIPNLARFYPQADAETLRSVYPSLPSDASRAECDALLGRILADGQVHLPVRLLAKDLAAAGFPVVRYTVEMVPEALGTNGIVSHGTDLVVHHLRLSMLSPSETTASLDFLMALNRAITSAIDGNGSGFTQHGEEEMLTLNQDGTTAWKMDWRWPQLRGAEKALRG